MQICMRMNRRTDVRSAMGRPGVAQWALLVAVAVLLLVIDGHHRADAKLFERCELAQVLRQRHALSLPEVALWVCIAQHSSGLNSAAYAGGIGGGSHGLFQISDNFWCSPPGQGVGCNIPCERLRDSDLTDDLACARVIYTEHQRISGDGYTAWNAYQQYCRYDTAAYISGCFTQAQAAASAAATNQVVRYQQPIAQQQTQHFANSISPNSIAAAPPSQKRGKVYNRCELAQELHYRHQMPADQLATWVCIAQHESNFDTAVVGRLNGDGSADHGLFQISDLYWCSNDQFSGGKACGLPCHRLLDSDIGDDVQCIRRIHEEHTRLSGDGFTAWAVYNPHCRNQRYEQVAACFKQKPPHYATTHHKVGHHGPNAIVPQKAPTALVPFGTARPHAYTVTQQQQQQAHHRKHSNTVNSQSQPNTSQRFQANPFLNGAFAARPQTHHHTTPAHRAPQAQSQFPPAQFHQQQPQHAHHAQRAGKVYSRCELAQELYFKHKFPMQDVATWVCIAQHESNFDTAAVGRLNGDGSADHGLFQISDLYWCSHDAANGDGGKACSISCNKLLDADIGDDVRCIRTIHDEHTRISGDGFTAWTVYNPHCRNQQLQQISSCFDSSEVSKAQAIANTYAATTHSVTVGGGSNSQAVATTSRGKVYQKCELAQELYFKHKIAMKDIPTWVCIAQHESSFNTAAVGRLNTDGSADHGLFQISDLFWCTHDQHGGKACNIPCDKLLDSDISDDVRCIQIIHDEHTRISGDGFTAWTVYNPHCRNRQLQEVSSCFNATDFQAAHTPSRASAALLPTFHTPSGSPTGATRGKVYQKCELANELYFQHKMPMKDIPTWVCIAQHESRFNTAAVGRLNTDGSADHGLFQISDLFWCSHDGGGGKACNIPCDKLLDSDITDDVRCVRTIFAEHTRLSGDGFTAWTVYQPHCRNQQLEQISSCFDAKELSKTQQNAIIPLGNDINPPPSPSKAAIAKGKIYNKCELAKELFFKHKIAMKDIPTWVCIAQHESSFNTAAVGRLNTDGSADHGLFQISDLFWCTHDQHGGKACNIPCNKLLDSDISDDVRCIQIIHDEHTRISGDGFTAWTVYNPHCRNQQLQQISSCFDSADITKAQQIVSTYSAAQPFTAPALPLVNRLDNSPPKAVVKAPSNAAYAQNPFLSKFTALGHHSKPANDIATVISKPQKLIAGNAFSTHNDKEQYKSNPFLQKYTPFKTPQAASSPGLPLLANQLPVASKKEAAAIAVQSHVTPNYHANPFLSKFTAPPQTSSTLIPLAFAAPSPHQTTDRRVVTRPTSSSATTVTVSSTRKAQIQPTRAYTDSHAFRTQPAVSQPAVTTTTTTKLTSETTHKAGTTTTNITPKTTPRPRLTDTLAKTTTATRSTVASTAKINNTFQPTASPTRQPATNSLSNQIITHAISTPGQTTNHFASSQNTPTTPGRRDTRTSVSTAKTVSVLKKPTTAFTTPARATTAATTRPGYNPTTTSATAKRTTTTATTRKTTASTKRPTTTATTKKSTTSSPSRKPSQATTTTTLQQHAQTSHTNNSKLTATHTQTTDAKQTAASSIITTTTTRKATPTAASTRKAIAPTAPTTRKASATSTATTSKSVATSTTTRRPLTTTRRTTAASSTTTTARKLSSTAKTTTTTRKQNTTNTTTTKTTTRRPTITTITHKQATPHKATTKKPFATHKPTAKSSTQLAKTTTTSTQRVAATRPPTPSTPKNPHSYENTNKYKDDPFSHPFFAKFNHEFSYFRTKQAGKAAATTTGPTTSKSLSSAGYAYAQNRTTSQTKKP